jgi:hypothetical protein
VRESLGQSSVTSATIRPEKKSNRHFLPFPEFVDWDHVFEQVPTNGALQ